VRLVILLYEQAIQDLRRAVTALERGDVQQRTQQVNHALLVIGQLQGTLDRERGGQIAVNLAQFYTQIRAGLMDAQCRQSKAQLEKQLALLMQVRSAWCEAEKAETAGQQPASSARSRSGESTSGQPISGEPVSAPESTSLSEWRA